MVLQLVKPKLLTPVVNQDPAMISILFQKIRSWPREQVAHCWLATPFRGEVAHSPHIANWVDIQQGLQGQKARLWPTHLWQGLLFSSKILQGKRSGSLVGMMNFRCKQVLVSLFYTRFFINTAKVSQCTRRSMRVYEHPTVPFSLVSLLDMNASNYFSTFHAVLTADGLIWFFAILFEFSDWPLRAHPIATIFQ